MIYIHPTSVFLGMTARCTVNSQKFNDGKNFQESHDKFHNAANFYFKDLLKSIQEKFPLDNFISNSVWIDVNPNTDMFYGKMFNIFLIHIVWLYHLKILTMTKCIINF